MAFVDDPVDGVAGFAFGRLFDDLENLLEPLDLIRGLGLVCLERSLQVFRLGSFGHLWKSGKDFLFGVVDIFQGLVKEVFKHLFFFGHGRLLDMLPVRWSNAASRREVPVPLRSG